MPNEKYGAGKDWNVYEDPENAYLLIKEAKNPGLEPSKSMMQRLYLGKILHILFPHNIPDVYAVSAEKGAKLKVQKIILDGESDAIRKLYQDKSITKLTQADLNFFNRIKKHPEYEKFRSTLAKLGLYIEVAPENFGFDADDHLFYLDSDVLDPNEAQVEIPQLILNLRRYISEIESEKEKVQALLYLESLEKLVT
ncbi:hypothetical protein KBC79_02415 [Candidatus Woesebacteria bacterium]|nr:hypothetical protein [Candidatus Woesebacteria bacterium]